MATATEEVAPVVAEVPAPEKVEEVKEAGAVEAPEKVEEEPKPAAEEGKKAEEADGKKPEEVEKKVKKPRSRKPKSAGPHHPPYFEMIKEAILSQDGKAGASPYAIAKHMGEKHRDVLPANYRKVLAVQLRNFAAKGRLVKVKASFKLAAAEEKKPAAAMARAKAPAAGKRKRAAASAAPAKKKKPAAPAEAKKARAKRARKAAPAPAQPMPKPKQAARPVRAAVARKAANKASA
ncbi:hypothetical protein SETIT_4G020700v2 [Setaria italica]|uniref:H15 domain-containing protein n=1 Tax=Setaria italica TaxID=4555 RepID=A0A368QQ46_SETIT|nr:histone H1 [Setaria italica]RCV20003.1 hypothetical protein SETIT_4G020700v2 [Setaria italica]